MKNKMLFIKTTVKIKLTDEIKMLRFIKQTMKLIHLNFFVN